MGNTYKPTWDLDVFFKGGSDSREFSDYLERLKKEINSLEKAVNEWQGPAGENHSGVMERLDLYQEVSAHLEQAASFVECLQAENMNDAKADQLKGTVTALDARLQTVMSKFDRILAEIDDEAWKHLMEQEAFKDLHFVLNERRRLAAEKLSSEEESLIHALSVDGFHGWEEMYNTIVSQTAIPFEENGEKKFLSVGQAENKFSSPDRQARKALFQEWEKAWENQASLLGTVLNHLAGFRLAVYQERGWDDILKEALSYNRMRKETLDTMWRVISQNKQPFVDYLDRKARLLGLDKLSWFDLEAPVGKGEHHYSYQEGADFIIDHFRSFGEKLAGFAKMAFENRWIEAEDRPGKRPGGFCTTFPASRQSRIFMTYSGTPDNVNTLAHELGHAFHSYVLHEVHPLNRDYAMNVAETASTLAEMIISDAAIRQAKSEEEKLSLLENKLQRSVAFFMNIHARFLFETRFYGERKNGIVSHSELSRLMEEAQKEGYAGALEQYHPMFWGSKLHFYITDVPFYNFPYTFGYLFSLGIYAKAINEGKTYEEKYISLLKDTGSMFVEDLAKKHLGADLTEEAFWQAGVDLCIKDAEEFLRMTEGR